MEIESENFGVQIVDIVGRNQKETEEYIYLSDGKIRSLDKLKKKNKKHVQPIGHADEGIRRKLKDGETVRNEEVKRAIKCYLSKVHQ